jgi:pSer/pThr/pTyr-binding forkhead associated (FHA) protein
MSYQQKSQEFPKNAFLIVNGTQVFPLTKSVITIGRMEDNDLIIQEPQISRYHAKLDAEHGQFNLTDLDSTGGTSINGTRITHKILNHGDVISLAGIPLLYGQSVSTRKLGEDFLENAKTHKPAQPSDSTTIVVSTYSIDQFLDLFEANKDE